MSDILNREAFHAWANECRVLGHDIVALKGLVPGMLDIWGEPDELPINVAWQDVVTKEVFSFEFKLPEGRAIALLQERGE